MELQEKKQSNNVCSREFRLSIDGKEFGLETETVISKGRENVFYKGVFMCLDPEIGLVNKENYLSQGRYDLNMVNGKNEVVLPLGKYHTKGSKIVSSIDHEIDSIVTIEIVFSLNGY